MDLIQKVNVVGHKETAPGMKGGGQVQTVGRVDAALLTDLLCRCPQFVVRLLDLKCHS